MGPRVLIAEDHLLTANGIQSLLEEQVCARVVATCTCGPDVRTALATHRPELITLDLALPGVNGLDMLDDLTAHDDVRWVIVYTSYDDDAYVMRAMRQGAHAFVLKGDDPHCLVEAVRHVLRNERYLSPSLSSTLVRLADHNDDIQDRYDVLTMREREVFQFVAEGYTSAEIAERLHISKRTVDKHRQNLMDKLDMSRVAEVVQLALRRGLLPGGTADF